MPNQPPDPANPNFLRDQNDWDTAELLAHTLKGLTGNIGLGSLQPLAEKLELAIKSRRSRDEVDARIDGPTRIAEMAREAEEQGRPSATDNRKKLDAVCNQLQSLLLAGDVGAVDVMDANAELLNAAFPHHCHEIDNNIRAFDFEAALAALRTATAKPA
ncbi:MAG: Hpt domain-containing protein [Sulfuricella sp.]|jgi:HPt (histidine-containing phosphotransfer) domain-containing protein